MRTVQMEHLRPEEILDEQKKISLVYLPVGPVEWHSYHMPLGTDALNAQEQARAMAAITGGVVAPTLFIGTEPPADETMLKNLHVPHKEEEYIVGMDFPNTTLPSMYFHEDVFCAVIREEVRLLEKMGFLLVAVISGHGGQMNALRRVCKEINGESRRIRCLLPEGEGDEEGEAFFAKAHAEGFDPGHADRAETALMLHLTQDVDLSRLPARDIPLHSEDFGIASGSQFMGTAPVLDGVVRDDPRDATAAFGERMFTLGVRSDARAILKYYNTLIAPK